MKNLTSGQKNQLHLAMLAKVRGLRKYQESDTYRALPQKLREIVDQNLSDARFLLAHYDNIILNGDED